MPIVLIVGSCVLVVMFSVSLLATHRVGHDLELYAATRRLSITVSLITALVLGVTRAGLGWLAVLLGIVVILRLLYALGYYELVKGQHFGNQTDPPS